MLLGAGLRISEAAALTVSDIEMNDRSGSVYVRARKGMKSRSLPLSVHVRKALGAYLKIRTNEDRNCLLLSRRGPLPERGIHAIVKKYAYEARLEDVTAHTLRHSFARNLVDAGTPLDQVATLPGHESLDTTHNVPVALLSAGRSGHSHRAAGLLLDLLKVSGAKVHDCQRKYLNGS